MQTFECHGDWLLDYADGALSQHELATANQHLTHCPACQRELAALQTSGARLDRYFAGLRRMEQCSVLPRASRWTRVAQRAAAIAACVAAIALGYWLNRQANSDVGPIEVVQHIEPPRTPLEHVRASTAHDDIAAEIARETQIARLKAAITILKEEPGMSERSAALQQYLVEAYQVELELPAM